MKKWRMTVAIAMLFLFLIGLGAMSADAGETRVRWETEYRWNFEVAGVTVRCYPDIVSAENARDQGVTVQIERKHDDTWIPVESFDLSASGRKLTDDILSDTQTVRLSRPLAIGDKIRITIKPFWGKGLRIAANMGRRAKGKEPERSEPLGQEVYILD